MRIWKLHALGNNFVFVLHVDGVDYSSLALALCRRDISVGADGLLTIDLSVSPPMVRMWNPDGTPDFCGNGLCCAALLIRHISGSDARVLGTPRAFVPVMLKEARAHSAHVTLRTPTPDFEPQTLPLELAHGLRVQRGWEIRADDRTFNVVSANNGTLHTVIFVDELPTDAVFNCYSRLIETHPLFPDRTNVLWCKIVASGVRIRIWERGVGETLSCGTGAAAAVAICSHVGYDLPNTVEVAMPGGAAYVSVAYDGVDLTTLATLVFEGDLISQPAVCSG